MMGPDTHAAVITPVRSDDDIALASQLARAFFDYMRVAWPERAGLIDDYLIAQDFEGQLADFRNHFTPPH